MNLNDSIRFVIVRALGNFLVLLSLYGVGAAFGPLVYYELQFNFIKFKGVHFKVNSTASIKENKYKGVNDITKAAEISGVDNRIDHRLSFLDVLAGSKEQELIPIDTQFSILIPKIAANERIFPNIDPDIVNEILPVLQKGIAHARGSVFPGMKGVVYLFAHSTDNWWNVGRYNAVFYLLKDLSYGDEIVLFYKNRRYNYVVTERFIADPEYVSLLSNSHSGNHRLVLQTCWPPGTSWKRLFVVARLQGEI